MNLNKKLIEICEELDDAKWLEDRCRVPTSNGYIDIKPEDGYLKVERKYNVKGPWDSEYVTVTLKNIKDIRKIENGIEAENDSGYLRILSKWIPGDYAWGPHYRSHIFAYDKNLNVL